MSDHKNPGHNSKKDFLKNPVEHIDITFVRLSKNNFLNGENVFCVKRNS
jgi:hypothetical protein